MAPVVVMAGGGTAGHVNPLLSTAHVLRERGAEVRVLGTAEGLESRLVPEAGLDLHVVPRVPLPRRPGPDLLTLPGRLRRAVTAASEVISGAEVVVGFGGYVSVPAYLAARRAGVPVVVHEQNARPGVANRLGARWARLVALTFDSTPLRARRGLTQVVGLPLRPSIGALAQERLTEQGRRAARERAAARLGLDPSRPTLLVTGGSLGALHLNEVMSQVMGDLPEGEQVLHLTGRGKDEAVRESASRAGVAERWHVVDYLTTMEDALAVADLVVCRSGAGTVAELTALGLPAVYVPLPIGNGEQRLNAVDHVACGGARLVRDADLTAERARTDVLALLHDEALASMREASAGVGRIDAAQRLAEGILRECVR